MEQRNEKNGLHNMYSYIAILRNKNVFEKYMMANNINTVKIVAIISNGILYDACFNQKMDDRKVFNNKKTMFIKSLDAECGRGIYCISNYSEYQRIIANIRHGVYIVQEKIIQHNDMALLNPNSINTLRIITIREKNGNISIFGILLRVGTKKVVLLITHLKAELLCLFPFLVN